MPGAKDPAYIGVMRQVIAETGAQMIFAQPDPEIAVLSEKRDELPVISYLPSKETVAACQDKYETYRRWSEADLRVPETLFVNNIDDLRQPFERYGDPWLRPVIGTAGRGALHTDKFEHARLWLEFNDGWGFYTAARYLRPESVTWQSIWRHGELIVAQSRRRLYWEFADRAPSGVTGITGTALTVADPELNDIALRAIHAVDSEPHGVFSVDMTYDDDGVPNPTEINIGRFFTTHLFFSTAGLNMPYILVKLAYGEEPPAIAAKINPLPCGLAWVRGMDMEPVLTTADALDAFESELADRLTAKI